MTGMQSFHYPDPFITETGASLQLTIAYKTYGALNADKSNVVWICHALTANADAESWWPGLVGNGCAIDPQKHFIVCANIMGSCYGTTGPTSINPATNERYNRTFPLITIRDMVRAHILLRRHLGIERILLLAGGSMGGYQAQEWALMEKEVVRNLLLLATSAAESAWGIAIHTAQRMAIEADETWQSNKDDGGKAGLKAARAIGMLTYRNYALFAQQQSDPDHEKLDGFKAATYLDYQGDKLVQRFNAYTYWTLTKSMDTHNLARGRNASIAEVLHQIEQPALVIGISSDILCPPDEQRFLASHLPKAKYEEIDSPYGHDGFLVEAEKIGSLLRGWMTL
jgi:homoserine O-acetyltransferase